MGDTTEMSQGNEGQSDKGNLTEKAS